MIRICGQRTFPRYWCWLLGVNWGSPLQLLFARGTISLSLSGALACTTYYFPNIYLPFFFLTDRIPYLHRPAILRTNSTHCHNLLCSRRRYGRRWDATQFWIMRYRDKSLSRESMCESKDETSQNLGFLLLCLNVNMIL